MMLLNPGSHHFSMSVRSRIFLSARIAWIQFEVLRLSSFLVFKKIQTKDEKHQSPVSFLALLNKNDNKFMHEFQ